MLPSIVAGVVNVPIIAVPTSIGYEFGDKDISALMAMLQVCSLGLAGATLMVESRLGLWLLQLLTM